MFLCVRRALILRVGSRYGQGSISSNPTEMDPASDRPNTTDERRSSREIALKNQQRKNYNFSTEPNATHV